MKAFHLHKETPVTRHQTTTRLYALSEEGMPKGNGLPETLLQIARFLDPTNSARYSLKNKVSHVYAHDFCYLAGAYLPLVWWGDANFGDGPKVQMTGTAVWDWLIDYGKEFGWKPVEDLKQAQELADVGHVVTIIALPKNVNSDARLTMVVPETKECFDPQYQKGIPCQSRAGKTFIKTDWYNGSSWREYKIYVNFVK